ncbi:MAG: hypothetical protein HY000_02755 [Planctomycetes bacterium]|nr:hypothetical protein [Planctomycetota bacterium]
MATSNDLVLFDAPGGPELVGFLEAKLQEVGLQARQPTAVFLTSTDDEAISGLRTLLDRTGCDVLVSKPGVERIKTLCPTATSVHDEDALATQQRWPVKALPLQGRGKAPMAYRVDCHGKTVLLSGPFLSKMGRGQREMRTLVAAMSEPGGDAEAYLDSLVALANLRVDVWLPATPVDGQNANVYGDEWTEVVAINRMIIERWMETARRK